MTDKIVSVMLVCRNYHVFYYLLAAASPADVEAFCLGAAREYFYLNQVNLDSLSSLCVGGWVCVSGGMCGWKGVFLVVCVGGGVCVSGGMCGWMGVCLWWYVWVD